MRQRRQRSSCPKSPDVTAQPTIAAARSYGQVVAAIAGIGRSHRPRIADLLIAATAHANGLAIYTCNSDDFAGLEGLVEVIGISLSVLIESPIHIDRGNSGNSWLDKTISSSKLSDLRARILCLVDEVSQVRTTTLNDV